MAELADLIRKKYPDSYNDMDDASLEKSVLTKHPQYMDLIRPKEAPAALKVENPEVDKIIADAKRPLGDIPNEKPVEEVKTTPEVQQKTSEEKPSFLKRFSDSVSSFLDQHPRVQEALTGTSPEFERMKKEQGITDVQGPGFMRIPGVDKAADYLSQKITGSEGTGRLALGAITKAIGDIISTGFDPRAIGAPKAMHEINPNIFDAEFRVHPSEGESLPVRRTPTERVSTEVPYKVSDDFNTNLPVRQDRIPSLTPPEFQPVGEEELAHSPAAKIEEAKGLTDDQLFKQAVEKFNMGRPLPEAEAAVKTPILAKHIGTQPGYQDIPSQELYNIEGGPEHGSTVTREGLEQRGIDIPENNPELAGKTGDQLRAEALEARKRQINPFAKQVEEALPQAPENPNILDFETGANKKTNNELMDKLSNLTPEDMKLLDESDRTGKTIDEILKAREPKTERPIDEQTRKELQDTYDAFIKETEAKTPELVENEAPKTMADHALAAADDMERRGDIEGAAAQRESISRMLEAQGHKGWASEVPKGTKASANEIIEHGSPEQFHPQLSGLKNYGDGVLYLDFEKSPKQLRAGDIEALLPEGSQVTELHTNENLPSRFRVDVKGADPVESADIADQIERSIGGSFESAVEMHGGPGGGKKPPRPFKGPSGPVLDKLFNALDEVRGLVEEQAANIKKQRAERFAAYEGVKTTGMHGAAKKLGKLSGEYEKLDYSDFEGTLNAKEVNSLFDAVDNAKLTTGEKARGVTALFKLLNGEGLPERNEIKILDDVFGSGFGNRIIEMHGGIGGVAVKMTKVANSMKSLKSAFDLSAPLRQGIGLIHRPEFREAMVEMVKFLAKPEYYKAAMQDILDDDLYTTSREAGLFLSKPNDFLEGEEAFMQSYVEHIPGVQASERAYTGFLNILRFNTFKNLIKSAEASGNAIYNTKQLRDKGGSYLLDEAGNVQTSKMPSQVMQNIAKYINVSTGRGSLGRLEKIAPELNMALWSPKFMSSRFTILNPKYYLKLDKFTRLQAVKSLFAIASAGLTVTALGKLAGGKVSTDPSSADFMKVRFGNNVVDPYAGFQQPIVATDRLIEELQRLKSGAKPKFNEPTLLGVPGRFLANKLSPAAALGYEIGTARQWTGGGGFVDQYGNKKNITPEIANSFVPMFADDAVTVFKSDAPFAEQIGLDAGSLLGMGIQNYPEPGSQINKKPSLFKKPRKFSVK